MVVKKKKKDKVDHGHLNGRLLSEAGSAMRKVKKIGEEGGQGVAIHLDGRSYE